MMNYLDNLLNDISSDFSHSKVEITETLPGILKISTSGQVDDGVILSCGIHGNETAPIEIINDLLTEIHLGEVIPRINLLIIFGHIEAMKKQQRFLDFNLNRLFNGQWANYTQAQESLLAQNIEENIRTFLRQCTGHIIHLDLHTALAKSHHERFAILPKKTHRPYNQEQLQMLSSLGLDALVLQSFESTTLSGFTEDVIQDRGFSATIELGKVMPFGQNNRQAFQVAQNSLRSLISTGKLPQVKIPQCYQVARALIKDHDEYKLCLDSQDINFTLLKPGRLLEEKQDHQTFAHDNEYIIFPNEKVKVGQRSGLIINNVNPYSEKTQDHAQKKSF